MLFIDRGQGIGRNTKANTPPITLRKTSIFGQKTKPINYYYTPGRVRSFGIKINPEGLALFLSESLTSFNNRFFEISDLGDRELLELESRVMESAQVEAKIQAVEEFVLKRLSSLTSNSDYLLFSAMVTHIKSVRGEIRSDMLSEKFNVNYKKVERLFKFFLGINSKTYIRIIRFNASIHLGSEINDLNLTQLGHELGFYDQSHFIREFKNFSSLTPKAFFKRPLSDSERINLEVIANRFKK
jgi:AraC-like DNA-binding protein